MLSIFAFVPTLAMMHQWRKVRIQKIDMCVEVNNWRKSIPVDISYKLTEVPVFL